jgi:hypothetical protein
MKICRRCGMLKPDEEFYAFRTMLDGRVKDCKVCFRDKARTYRLRHLARVRAHDRERGRRKRRRRAEVTP